MDRDSRDPTRVAHDAASIRLTDAPAAAAADSSVRRWNLGRDVVAVVFLVGATLLPWNLFFGVGIPGSNTAWFAVLVTVTVLAVGSIVAAHARRPNMRIRLCAPYALFVVAVVLFDLFETFRYGGNPGAPGVGPGVWLGAAGAVLASQPVLTGDPHTDIDQRRPWLAAARLVGAASVILAALSVGFTLFWQTSQAIPGMSHAELFGRSVATIATAVVYDAAALAPVIVGAGWILQRNKGSRLATIALGISTLAAGLLVWISHVGRDIDVYHGIAQITSLTSAVGFEGYLAWTVAAAMFAPLTLRAVLKKPFDAQIWRQAARKGLLLMVVGCAGAAMMRIADLVVTLSFGVQRPIFDGIVLIIINAAAAALAWWLRHDHGSRTRVASALPAAYAILVLLSVSRVVAALALAPRQPGLSAAAGAQPVYGNALAQQLTSTFDIVLCFVAFGIAAAALLAARTAPPASASNVFDAVRNSSQRLDPDSQRIVNSVLRPAIPMPAAPATRPTPTTASNGPGRPAATATSNESGTPSNDFSPPPGKQGVDAVLQASTQRFAAGTTYTERGASTRGATSDDN